MKLLLLLGSSLLLLLSCSHSSGPVKQIPIVILWEAENSEIQATHYNISISLNGEAFSDFATVARTETTSIDGILFSGFIKAKVSSGTTLAVKVRGLSKEGTVGIYSQTGKRYIRELK